jgi:uncharacterized OsmC-like protein
MITTMAIRAKDLEPKLIGVKAETEKIMTNVPRRRVGGLNITFHWGEGVEFTQEERTKLEEIAWTCPVKESIHPDIHLSVNFNW